jgi:transaldolase
MKRAWYILSMTKPSFLNTMIFLDSGNPDETRLALAMLGFLDGQTTNPSLVAKNPHVLELQKSSHFTSETIWEEYKKVALEVKNVIPKGFISVEVYADGETGYDAMLAKAHELASWFPGIFVKLPATKVGLQVANILVKEGICVNITLCFSQEQAAAVHAATKGARKGQVYISPFIGRLDDIGINGLDLIENIVRMYRAWESHVMVLSASIRTLDHIIGSIQKGTDIITIPLPIIEQWKQSEEFEKDPMVYVLPASNLKPITYKDLKEGLVESYDLHHELTDKGIEKFSSDWKKLFEN